MLILAFETSAKAASVALHDGKKLLGESYQNTGLTHSQTLLVMAEDLLRQCGLSPKDVTAVAVAEGPGSFTGVRIGVAAAKGFAWGAELNCYGVSTLEAMAKNLGIHQGYVCAAMDARRSQVYTATFAVENGEFRRLTPDSAISLDELQMQLKDLEKNKLLVGDGAQLCYNNLNPVVSGLVLAPEHLRMQRASGVALLAWEQAQAGESPSGLSVTPNYLRLSQAERERQKKILSE